jgi:hypothetical protein
MSVVLTYSVPGRDLSQLHDELLRAAALLTPPADADNTPELVQGDDPDVILTMPDGVDEPAIDALVAAHVPMARYDATAQLARVAAVREAARLLSDYDRLQKEMDAIVTLDDAKAVSRRLIEVLKRRDRAAGIY